MKYSFKEIEEAAIKILHCCNYANMLVELGNADDGILTQKETADLAKLLRKILTNFEEAKEPKKSQSMKLAMLE